MSTVDISSRETFSVSKKYSLQSLPFEQNRTVTRKESGILSPTLYVISSEQLTNLNKR